MPGAYRVNVKVSTKINFTLTRAAGDECHIPYMRNEDY
jgi:hypothetical protein